MHRPIFLVLYFCILFQFFQTLFNLHHFFIANRRRISLYKKPFREKDRQALERQVSSLRNETKKSLDQASNDRKQLKGSIDLVEAERARLEARVKLLEQEVRSLRQFTGMPDLYKPASKTPAKYKNNPVQDRNLSSKK